MPEINTTFTKGRMNLDLEEKILNTIQNMK